MPNWSQSLSCSLRSAHRTALCSRPSRGTMQSRASVHAQHCNTLASVRRASDGTAQPHGVHAQR
eukprot:11205584-Lingulodinium_polyedra.AAC.1